MVRIRYMTGSGEATGGFSSLEVAATTVGAALRALTEQHPELARLIWAGKDTLNPMIAVFLNDQQVEASQLNTAVKPGDEIDLLAAVSGG